MRQMRRRVWVLIRIPALFVLRSRALKTEIRAKWLAVKPGRGNTPYLMKLMSMAVFLSTESLPNGFASVSLI